MLRDQVFTSIDDVPAETWDAVAPPGFFFFKVAFLRVQESSGVENARYRYVILYEGEEAVGLAVLSRFKVRLDLASGEEWAKKAHRVVPWLLEPRMIMCGIPASLSQRQFHVAREELRAEAVKRVDAAMQAWAREEPAPVLCWKEFDGLQGMREPLERLGYMTLPSVVDHWLYLPGSREEWLSSMRSSYRRKYKQAAKLMSGEGPEWRDGDLTLSVQPFDVDTADEFFRGYIKLMERTKVRLETYTHAWFRGLAESDELDARAMILTNHANGEKLVALLVADADVLAFALVAKDHDRYEDALYAVLLRCIALYAIEEGFGLVRMGQTSGYPKISMGSKPRPLDLHLRMRGRVRHKLLERFAGQLFVEEESPELSVFKEA